MGRLLAIVSLAAVLLVAPAAARADDPLSHGETVLDRDVAAACARYADPSCQPETSPEALAEFEASPTHAALLFQHELAGDVGMRNAPWVGTHNSFNSIAEMGPTLSDLDSNQQLTLVEQLGIGVRSLELDLHLFPSATGGGVAPVVCHAQGPAGCSVEKPLDVVLGEIAGWLDDHPDQVILLYLENQLMGAQGEDLAAADLREELGDRVYAPRAADGECGQLPPELTRDDVRAAGAQVLLVGTCGSSAAWRAEVHGWDDHEETRPQGFEDFPSCGPDFDRETYDTALVRYFEDSTWLTNGGSAVGATEADDGITPQTAAAMTRCGVDLLGLDQLVPSDGRLPAVVWTWADGQPAAGDCAAQRADTRWESAACGTRMRAACRTGDGGWTVTRQITDWAGAARACAVQGATFAAPRTGYENATLDLAQRGAKWIAVRRGAAGWDATDLG